MADEIDVDKLLADIEAPTPERAMTSTEGAPKAPEPAPVADTWNGKEWEFDVGGKKVFPDTKDKARTWMSLGHSASQRMGELNRTHAQRMAEIEQLQAKYKGYERYSPVDEYARKNPEWWKHVETQWQQRQHFQAGQDPAALDHLKPVLERLQKTEEVLQEFQTRKQQEEEKEQDKALANEIEAVRKTFPKIDFDSLDATGESLELRILKHANTNHIPSFRAAARDYLHDNLIELTKAEALETAAKGTKEAAKKGFLSRTQQPTKGLVKAQNTKDKSWDALAKEALSELGIA